MQFTIRILLCLQDNTIYLVGPAQPTFEPSNEKQTAIRPETQKMIFQHKNTRPDVAKVAKTYLEIRSTLQTLQWAGLSFVPINGIRAD